MTDPAGNTAERLHSVGIDSIAPLDDPDQILQQLDAWLTQVRCGSAPVATVEEVALHSRRARTEELAQLLEEL
jgi:hypothetical protein